MVLGVAIDWMIPLIVKQKDKNKMGANGRGCQARVKKRLDLTIYLCKMSNVMLICNVRN